MSATLRDLAAPEPWQASLERSRARRGQARRRGKRTPGTPAITGSPAHRLRESYAEPGRPQIGLRRMHAAIGGDSPHSSPHEPHGSPQDLRLAQARAEPLAGRDLAEVEPWKLSIGRSRARRRACQLRFVPATTRARRISLGTLLALIAAPPASLGDLSGGLAGAPAKPAAPPTTTAHEVQLSTGSESRQVRQLQKALKLTVDGVYGPESEHAVLAHQASRGLIVDNTVGRETKVALAHHAPAVRSPQKVNRASGTPTARIATAAQPRDVVQPVTDHDRGSHTARAAFRRRAQRDTNAGGTAGPEAHSTPAAHKLATRTPPPTTLPQTATDGRAGIAQATPVGDRVHAVISAGTGGTSTDIANADGASKRHDHRSGTLQTPARSLRAPENHTSLPGRLIGRTGDPALTKSESPAAFEREAQGPRSARIPAPPAHRPGDAQQRVVALTPREQTRRKLATRAVTNTSSGFSAFALCVAELESGMNWTIDTGNGYEGAFQWLPSSWIAMGGGRFARRAIQATPAEQVQIFEENVTTDPGAWPSTVPQCLHLRSGGSLATQRASEPAAPASAPTGAPAAADEG